MDRVWAKLEEHDKRFDRIEAQMTDVIKELSNAKFWFVGTAFAIALEPGGIGTGSGRSIAAHRPRLLSSKKCPNMGPMAHASMDNSPKSIGSNHFPPPMMQERGQYIIIH